MTTTVKTQKELDAALASDETNIIIDSPRDVWLRLSASGSARVRAYGSATVRAYGSATVEAYDSATVRAYGSATVRASGSATVEAYDSATVEAYGSATVEAYGSARVRAYGSARVRASGSATVRASGSARVRASGSATVRAYDSATVEASGSATVEASGSATVEASPYVAVHLFSARVTHSGGVVIDIAALDRSDWSTWAQYWGVEYTATKSAAADELIVYKAVDDNLRSGRGFEYPIGETVTAPDWQAGDFCGGGLHLSPRPHQARQYFTSATRFLECAVKVSDVSIIDGNSDSTPKLKARAVRIIREVNIDGEAIS